MWRLVPLLRQQRREREWEEAEAEAEAGHHHIDTDTDRHIELASRPLPLDEQHGDGHGATRAIARTGPSSRRGWLYEDAGRRHIADWATRVKHAPLPLSATSVQSGGDVGSDHGESNLEERAALHPRHIGVSVSEASATPLPSDVDPSILPAYTARAAERALHRASSIRVAPSSDPATAAATEQTAIETVWRQAYGTQLRWDKKLRFINVLLCIIAALHYAAIIAAYQFCWSDRTLDFSFSPGHCSILPALLHLTLVFSVAFIGVLLWYYVEKSKFKALVGHFNSPYAAFYHTGLRTAFLKEFVATLIQPFPFIGLLFNIHHAHYLWLIALIARIYLIFRVLRDFSEAYQKRFFIKQNSRFDTSFYRMDSRTIAKAYLYRYTGTCLAAGVALSFLLLAYLMHLAEREYWRPQSEHAGLAPVRWRDVSHDAELVDPSEGPVWFGGDGQWLLLYHGHTYYPSPFATITNCLYFVGIVATSTGLGDVAPVTYQGKMFAVSTAIIGILWTSFGVGLLANVLVPNPFQAYVLDYMARSNIERDKHTHAARIIQRAWRHYLRYRQVASGADPVAKYKRAMQLAAVLRPAVRALHRAQRQEQHQGFMLTQRGMARAHKNDEATAYGEQPNFQSLNKSDTESERSTVQQRARRSSMGGLMGETHAQTEVQTRRQGLAEMDVSRSGHEHEHEHEHEYDHRRTGSMTPEEPLRSSTHPSYGSSDDEKCRNIRSRRQTFGVRVDSGAGVATPSTPSSSSSSSSSRCMTPSQAVRLIERSFKQWHPLPSTLEARRRASSTGGEPAPALAPAPALHPAISSLLAHQATLAAAVQAIDAKLDALMTRSQPTTATGAGTQAHTQAQTQTETQAQSQSQSQTPNQ